MHAHLLWPDLLLVILTGVLLLLAFGPSARWGLVIGNANQKSSLTNWLFWMGTASVFMIPALLHMDDPIGTTASIAGLIYLQYTGILWAVGALPDPGLRRALRALWLTFVVVTLPLYLSGHWSGLYVVFVGLGFLAVVLALVRYLRSHPSPT